MTTYLIDGLRTPFGNFGGALKSTSPVDMGSHVISAVLQRTGVQSNEIDAIIFGNVIQNGGQGIYLSRHIGLEAGLNMRIPALTVNRLCGSGLEAVVQASMSIELNHNQAVIAGGVESMSQAPYVSHTARYGQKMGDQKLEDALMSGLTDGRAGCSMGQTAENLALDYSISREQQDTFAIESQSKAEIATEKGLFAEEIAPITVTIGREEAEFTDDEFIRGARASEKIKGLRPAFVENGTVTAGNASGINDGASAILAASETFVETHGLKPYARIVSYVSTGCRPDRMGLGPAYAIPLAMEKAGLTLDDMDLIEVNEAFAAQVLAVVEELKIPVEKLNVNGGAIALGHPLGASGNRVLLTLMRELKRRNGRYGVASLCIGGGQGIAMIIEAL